VNPKNTSYKLPAASCYTEAITAFFLVSAGACFYCSSSSLEGAYPKLAVGCIESTVVGPPFACTPVYRDLSSWNLFASAVVPVNLGPPCYMIEYFNVSTSTPFNYAI